MKTIITILICTSFFIGCSKRPNEEPFNVYIEDGIPKTGIEIWDKRVNWVGKDENPDILIVKTNQLPNNTWYAVEMHETRLIFGISTWMIRPAYIYVRRTNDIVMAHEFGHFLGHDHNCKDDKSIMCPSYTAPHRELRWFTEFNKDVK